MKAILNKLYLVQKDIEKMNKDGYNQNNKYNYLSETQITEKMKELLDKNKVVFNYSSKTIKTTPYNSKNGSTMFLVEVEVPYKFYDVESGEFLEGIATGHGADMGDKGVYKAITGAVKYIYMKTFNIPTGDDAEKDSPELTTTYHNEPATNQSKW